MIKTKLLSCALISTLALSSYGANCPPGYSISISGSGSGNCGATDTFSVSTQNSWDTYSWSISPVAGSVLKSATISNPSSQSTGVTAYWLNNNEAFSCSWKLKCTASATDSSGKTIQCEADTTIGITVPSDAGEVDPNEYYNIWHNKNTAQDKWWVTRGIFTCSGSNGIHVDPSLSSSIFYNKIYKHEEKHDADLNNSSYISQFVSNSKFEQELQSSGLMSESTTSATTYDQLWDEAEEIIIILWDQFIHDLEVRAYAVSDPIWPQVLYMSNNAEY